MWSKWIAECFVPQTHGESKSKSKSKNGDRRKDTNLRRAGKGQLKISVFSVHVPVVGGKATNLALDNF